MYFTYTSHYTFTIFTVAKFFFYFCINNSSYNFLSKIKVVPKSSQNSSAAAEPLTKISICLHPLWRSPLLNWHNVPSWISMIRSTAGSHLTSTSSSCPGIWSGSLQCYQNVTPWASISSLGVGKNHRGRGLVSWEGGGWLSCLLKPKTAAQQATHEPRRCHDAEPRSCCTKCLDVCAGYFPSITSEHSKRIFHSPSVPVEQIPCAWCLQCKKTKWTMIWHCSELVVLSSVIVKMESSTEMTADSSWGCTQTPIISHQ